jgi:hypothetical protein
MRKLILAVAMVALIAAPAFAAVQNVKVSGSITTTSILVKNITTDGDLTNRDIRGSDILAQTQLNVEADLTDNVSAKIGLINERLWGRTAAASEDSSANIDLETAYVTMKEFLYSPLTLTVGRQPLKYGNQLIIGQNTVGQNLSTNLPQVYGGLSKLGNFDAIKAVLGYDPVTIDLFASRISNHNTVVDSHGNNDNANLYGIVASTKLGDKMSTVVEGYLFAKMNDTTINPPTKAADTYVPGLRVSVNPAEGLAVSLEAAYEAGHTGTSGALTPDQTRSAYAFQGMVSFAIPGMKDLSPVVSAEYKYLSGDAECTAAGCIQKTGKTWDRMYENQDSNRLFDALGIGDSDLQLAKLSAQITPLKDLTTELSWYGLWKAEKGNYRAGNENSSKYYGSEVDADITYAYTEDVKIGLSAEELFTGKVCLPYPGNNKNASAILTSVSVSF